MVETRSTRYPNMDGMNGHNIRDFPGRVRQLSSSLLEKGRSIAMSRHNVRSSGDLNRGSPGNIRHLKESFHKGLSEKLKQRKNAVEAIDKEIETLHQEFQALSPRNDPCSRYQVPRNLNHLGNGSSRVGNLDSKKLVETKETLKPGGIEGLETPFNAVDKHVSFGRSTGRSTYKDAYLNSLRQNEPSSNVIPKRIPNSLDDIFAIQGRSDVTSKRSTSKPIPPPVVSERKTAKTKISTEANSISTLLQTMVN